MIAAPTAIPIPVPSAATFRFSSRLASSSSSFAIALAWSATSFAAAPTPPFWLATSVSGGCMAPPVDHLREDDPRREADADHEPRRRARAGAALLGLGPRAELRYRRRNLRLAGSLVGRRLALRALDDQARLQLADELRVLGERLGELRLQPALRAEPVG